MFEELSAYVILDAILMLLGAIMGTFCGLMWASHTEEKKVNEGETVIKVKETWFGRPEALIEIYEQVNKIIEQNTFIPLEKEGKPVEPVG